MEINPRLNVLAIAKTCSFFDLASSSLACNSFHMLRQRLLSAESSALRTAISQDRHSLRRFFCPRNTRINANPVQVSREGLWQCGASSARGITHRPSIRELGSQYPMGFAPLFASVRFDPKRHEDVSHSKCFAKSSKTSFLLAFHSRVSRAELRLRRSRAG